MLSYTQFLLKLPVLNEVSQKFFDKIADRVEALDPNKLPLHYVFGDKLRLAIPLGNSEIQRLTEALQENGFEVDYAKGIATKTTKTERGLKKQPIKIGRAIELLVKSGKIEKQWWDYWNRESGFLMKQARENPKFIKSTEPEYYIIVSRSPVDLLRMSDFSNIQSCHSQGGGYFACAIQEAMDGGAIAYAVDADDLKKVPDLQAPEIFADRERRIAGIQPESRMRIRLFVGKDDDKIQLAVPEKRIYGETIPGFRETINKFLKKKMEPVFHGERPRMSNFLLRGGWYHDNTASALFNDFFGDQLDKGDVGRMAGKGEEDAIEAHNQAMRDEIEEIDRIKNKDWEHPIHVYYTESDEPNEGGAIDFSWDAMVRFSFPTKLWNPDAWKQQRSYQLMREFSSQTAEADFEDADTDDKNAQKVIQHWDWETRDAEGNYKTWTEPNPEYGKGEVHLDCRVRSDGGGHPDRYREFISKIKETYDKNYPEMYAQMRGFLVEKGVLTKGTHDKLIDIVGKERFQHFTFEDSPYSSSDQKSLYVQSEPMPVLNLMQLKTHIKNWPKQSEPYGSFKNPDTAFTQDQTGNAWSRGSQVGYWPGMNTKQKFNLVQQAAMVRVKQWWDRVKQGYEQQPFLPTMKKPPFKDRMQKMMEPQLEFDWRQEWDWPSDLRVVVRFPFAWNMQTSQVIAALRGIHFIDNNFDRFIDDIRVAVTQVFEREIGRYTGEEQRKAQQQPHFANTTTIGKIEPRQKPENQ